MKRLLMAILALLFCSGVASARSPTLSQQVTSGGGSSLPSVMLNANDALVLQVGSSNSGRTFTVSDNNGGTWTHVTGFPEDNGASVYDLWVSVGHPAGATVISTTNGFRTAHLSVFSGVATGSAIDTQNKNASASTSTPRTGLVTTGNANDVIVGGAYNLDGQKNVFMASDYGSGGGAPILFTQVQDGAGTTVLDSSYQIVSATGSYGFQFNSYGSNSNPIAGIVALKAAGATPTPTPSATPTSTPTATPTSSPTPTPVTPVCSCPPGYVLNASNLCVWAATPTPIPSPSPTPVPTATPTPTPTGTPTPRPTPTSTTTPTSTPTPTPIATPTPSPTPMPGSGSVAISQPAPNQTVAGNTTFAATTTGSVASVDFVVGSLKLGTAPSSIVWNTGYQGDGTYYVQAVGRDAGGNKIATSAPQAYVVNNHGTSMNVTAPDLSQPVSGTLALSYTETDPAHVPYLAQLYIDGSNVANGWTDNSTSHTNNLTANIDTTVFANGPHELNLTMIAGGGNFYEGGYNRVIDIENGRKLMEVAANYLEVYLQPGGTTQLTCGDLFTDATSAPCTSPTYSSSDPSHVAVDGSGNVTAASSEGFSIITIGDGGKTTQVYVTVRTSPGIPHFASNGQMLNTYTPGQSLFTVSLFFADIGTLQSNPTWLAAFKSAGINTLSQGIYSNPRNTSQDLASWKAAYDNNYTILFNWAAQQGFSLLFTGDDITRGRCDDAWYTLNWSSGQQAVQYAFSQAARAGNAIGVDMVDEADAGWAWGPTPRPATDWTGACTIPKTWITTLRSWITAANPTVAISWPNLGIAGVSDWANWDGVGGVADYVTQYYDSFVDSHTYAWSAGILEKNYWMWKLFYDRQPFMMLDRPQLQLRSTAGAFYTKESGNGAFYSPPADILIQPGDIGPVVSSGIMTAAALGEAGVRLYQWENPGDASIRAGYANGVQLQTGVNSIDGDRELSANWKAIANASNAVNALTPYLLANPLNSPAYGRNIISTARQGTSGRLLLIVNDNDFERTIPVDFTPFMYAGGSVMKKLVSAETTTNAAIVGSGESLTLDAGQAAAYVFTR